MGPVGPMARQVSPAAAGVADLRPAGVALLAGAQEDIILTSEELLERSDLVAIDGVLYNLKALAPVHPGGAVINAAGAYDASALFHSMHTGKDPLKSQLLQEHRVGVHKHGAEDTVFIYDSPFAKDVIASVRKALSGKSWYAGAGFWARTATICILTVVFEWYWATTGLLMWGVLAGIMHAQIGLSVQHDASHGALSSNPSFNALFSYGADWIGSCRWIWLQQHVLWHHPYTNVHGKDLDCQSAEPFIIMHDYSASSTKHAPPASPFAKFQHLVTNIILMFYGPSIVYNFKYMIDLRHSEQVPLSVTSGPYMSAQKPTVWALRAWYLVRIVLAPWYLANRQLLVSMFLVNWVCGSILTFVFVVSHNFEGADRDPVPSTAKDPVCWYKAQAETSSTYGGKMAGFFTGGLNFQIEHHLFPRVSSWHYPMLRPIVEECCKRHGVEYNYFPSLASNLVSMWKYMRKVGVIAVIKMAHEE